MFSCYYFHFDYYDILLSNSLLQGNGLEPGFIVSAKKASTKWNHLVNKRRFTRQYSVRSKMISFFLFDVKKKETQQTH